MSKKILIISDTHLSHQFDKNKFLFLKNLILSANLVIINGDFWDFWLTDFDKFIKSPWRKLFPILKTRKCVYIFGNHDPEEMSDDRVEAFSNISCIEHSISTESNNFRICHGDKLVRDRSIVMRLYANLLNRIQENEIRKPVYKIAKKIEAWGYSNLGTALMTKSGIGKNWNNNIKKYQTDNQFDRWLICGDTHTAEIDEENRFANSGCILHGHGSYIVLEDENVVLKREDYRNINFPQSQ